MPGDLEHEWQMRRSTTMTQTLFDLYQWVSKGDASRVGFDTWLKDKLLNWYTQHVYNVNKLKETTLKDSLIKILKGTDPSVALPDNPQVSINYCNKI